LHYLLGEARTNPQPSDSATRLAEAAEAVAKDKQPNSNDIIIIIIIATTTTIETHSNHFRDSIGGRNNEGARLLGSRLRSTIINQWAHCWGPWDL